METTQKNNVLPEANSDNIVMFDLRDDAGTSKPNGDDKPDGGDNPNGDDKPNGDLDNKQETVKDKPEGGDKPNGDDKPDGDDKPKNEKDKSKDNKDGNDKPEKLTFEFDSDINEKDKPDPKADKGTQETAKSVTKEGVVEFLNKHGFEGIKDLTDLSFKETLPEAVKEFKKFHEETNGRGIEDFYNLQKNWDNQSPEDRIKAYLSLKYPTLTDEQLETQFNVYNVTEADEDEMSPRELTKAKAEFDRIDGEAKTFLKKMQQEYKTPLGNAKPQQQPKPQTEEDVIKTHGNYWKQRDAELAKIDDFSFNIKGLGEIKVAIDEDDKKAIQARTRTTDDMINSWANEDKSLNARALIIDNMFAIPSIRQKLIKGIAEQTHTLTVESLSKTNRNVTLDNLNHQEKPKNNNNRDLVIIKDPSAVQSDSQFGQPVFTPRKK